MSGARDPERALAARERRPPPGRGRCGRDRARSVGPVVSHSGSAAAAAARGYRAARGRAVSRLRPDRLDPRDQHRPRGRAAPVTPGPGSADPGNPTQQNLIGAVIYLPLGGQGADKPYIGPVGTPEMYARLRETTYEVTVRMDDGSARFVRRPDATAYGVGDRVRWIGGDELELLVN